MIKKIVRKIVEYFFGDILEELRLIRKAIEAQTPQGGLGPFEPISPLSSKTRNFF